MQSCGIEITLLVHVFFLAFELLFVLTILLSTESWPFSAVSKHDTSLIIHVSHLHVNSYRWKNINAESWQQFENSRKVKTIFELNVNVASYYFLYSLWNRCRDRIFKMRLPRRNAVFFIAVQREISVISPPVRQQPTLRRHHQTQICSPALWVILHYRYTCHCSKRIILSRGTLLILYLLQ